MKKLLSFFLILSFTVVLFGQQVQKNYVLMEVFTSTGCYYCPGAELGADDLLENGQDVAVLAYHHNSFGDTLYIPAGLSRINYYGYVGTPDVYFNGDTSTNVVGGDHTESLYSYYLPIYNNMSDDLTSFTCDATLSSNNDIDYTVSINTNKVSDYTGTNIKLFAVLTESDIPYTWQGITGVNHLVRGVYPGSNGIALDFSSQNNLTNEISFSLKSHWVLENMELVVFVQNMTTKEILQTNKYSLLVTYAENNVMLQKISDPTEGEVVCEGLMYPTILFKNKGSETLTSCKFESKINDIVIDTYQWNGSLASNEQAEISLDLLEFDILNENELVITAIEPNNVEDDDISNNMATSNFVKSDETTTRIILDMFTGTSGFTLKYKLYDGLGNELYYSGNLSSNQPVKDTFDIEIGGCYYFELYDSQDDGFNTTNGYCRLLDDRNGPVILEVLGNFGSVFGYTFQPTNLAPISDFKNTEINIYPNPASTDLHITFEKSGDYNLDLFSADGKKVISTVVSNGTKSEMKIENLTKGIYYLSVSGDINLSEKIIIE